MSSWSALALSLVLAGPAMTPTVPTHLPTFNDGLFAAPSSRIHPHDVFAVSDAMKSYLTKDIAAELKASGSQRGLFDALYRRDQLQLAYDSKITRNASEAFDARSGNCLSLAILTAALAKELGLSVRFHQISIDEAWTRAAGLDVLDEHVNVSLHSKVTDADGQVVSRKLTVDFVPRDKLRRRRTREIPEQTIVAMYMGNRAAESLANHRVDDAYWFAREAIAQDPEFLGAYNTLGVIYRRHGDLAEAEQVFGSVLKIEPDNTIAMANLVLVLNGLGRTGEANTLADRLREIRPYPPFHFYDQGRDAMQRGDYAAAKTLFLREIQRDASYDKSHFWLAQAYYRLGDLTNARKQLAIAQQTGSTSDERNLYAAKLASLSSPRN